MAFVHTMTATYSTGPTDSVGVSMQNTADGEDNRDIAVPKTTVDMVVDLAAVAAQIKGICIKSDKDVTVKTYAAEVLKQTISVPGEGMLMWMYGQHGDCPITNDFDSIKISNAGAEDAVVNVRLLVDSTQ